MAWVYKTIKLAAEGSFFVGKSANVERINAELNELGKVGWELVTALDTTGEGGVSREVVMILKRPTSEKTSQLR